MDSTADLARSAVDALESGKVVIEMIAGYRNAAIEAGFSEHMAEHMAIDYHAHLLRQIEKS